MELGKNITNRLILQVSEFYDQTPYINEFVIQNSSRRTFLLPISYSVNILGKKIQIFSESTKSNKF